MLAVYSGRPGRQSWPASHRYVSGSGNREVFTLARATWETQRFLLSRMYRLGLFAVGSIGVTRSREQHDVSQTRGLAERKENSMSHSDRSASFYDGIASSYDREVARDPGYWWTRAAFRQFVADEVPVGSTLLDFGCGTGLDAAWYAKRGYQVAVYDNSAGMLAQLRTRCAEEISSGTVVLIEMSYEDFLSGADASPAVDAVVANFAVLNQIQKPSHLFYALEKRLRTGGRVIVSVLNPFYWQDVQRRIWWKHYWESRGLGLIRSRGADVDTFRHFISKMKRAVRPDFRFVKQASVRALVRQVDSEDAWSDPRSLSERVERRWWKRFPLNRLGQFIFLAFRSET